MAEKIQTFSEKDGYNIQKAAAPNENNVSMAVIAGDELQEIMDNIINKMVGVVARTMGPYGKNAIIQNMSGVTITKDGWLTSQALNIGDTIAEKSLCSILLDASASTNIKAGDGTSSTFVVAGSLHRQIREYLKDHFMNVRDIENTMNAAFSLVKEKLIENAHSITKNNLRDSIYRMALVSTNWDEEMAKIITEIYVKTENPIIKRVNSATEATTYEIMEGYDLASHLILQETYLTDFETRTRVVEKPMILVFDNTLPDDMFEVLFTINNYIQSLENGPNLVVIAKGFVTSFVNKLVAINLRNQKNGQPPVPITLIEYHAPAAIDRECVLDFCDLVGAEIIAGDSDIRRQLDNLAKSLQSMYADLASGNQEKINKTSAECQNATVDIFQKLMEVAGACEVIHAGDKSLIAKGIITEGNEALATKKGKLRAEINDLMNEATSKTIVSNSVHNKQIRLGKLECNMGIIHVGARGTAHLKARNDAVDDALRACELAFTSGGYTIGGSYAVPHVIRATSTDDIMLTANDYGVDPTELIHFLGYIAKSFVDVINVVVLNKYGSNTIPEELDKAIDNGITVGTPVNIITEKPDENLIEPVMVDIEILNSALSMFMTLETTDQYLYTAYETIDSGRKPSNV